MFHISKYTYNGDWIHFQFEGKDAEKAKKLEAMTQLFQKRVDNWRNAHCVNMFYMMGCIGALIFVTTFNLMSLGNVQFVLYGLLGGGAFSAISLIFSFQMIKNNVVKEIAVYAYATSLLSEGQFKSHFSQITQILRVYHYNYWPDIYDCENYLDSNEKEKIRNILEVSAPVDSRIPESVCSQTVGAKSCPCQPPCVPMSVR